VIVDNVFATPTYSKAVALGADVVVYSATKHIDGSGRCLGGIVCGTKHYIRKVLEPYLKHTGAALSPFNAWVMLKGLETLDLRVRQQADSALQIARALKGHEKLARVVFPGLKDHAQHAIAMEQMGSGGTVVTLEVRDGQEGAFRFLNALEIVLISNNLGDAKSIITHPATTTHQRLPADQKALLGITPGLVRLSVGLEDPEDLIGDLTRALGAV
jgi:O-succinylhomoserine sulfhydrylase